MQKVPPIRNFPHQPWSTAEATEGKELFSRGDRTPHGLWNGQEAQGVQCFGFRNVEGGTGHAEVAVLASG